MGLLAAVMYYCRRNARMERGWGPPAENSLGAGLKNSEISSQQEMSMYDTPIL